MAKGLEGRQELERVKHGLICRAWNEAARDGAEAAEGVPPPAHWLNPSFSCVSERLFSRPHGRTMIGFESYSIPLVCLLVGPSAGQ